MVQPRQLFDLHVAAVRFLDVTVTHDDVVRQANQILVGSLVVVNNCEALCFRCGPVVPGMAPEVKESPSVACPTVDLLIHARARHLGMLAVGRRAALDRIDVERPRRAQRVRDARRREAEPRRRHVGRARALCHVRDELVGVDLDDPVVSRLDLVDPAREVVFDVVQIDEAVAEVDGIARRHVLEVVFLGARAAVEHVKVLETVHVPVPREPPRRQRPVVLRHNDEGDLGAGRARRSRHDRQPGLPTDQDAQSQGDAQCRRCYYSPMGGASTRRHTGGCMHRSFKPSR